MSTLADLDPPAINYIDLPLFSPFEGSKFVQRQADVYTIIPSRPRYDVVNYTVELGDSVFGIAFNFGVEPETVLWSNYDQLKDNPHTLSSGMDLKIPPTDGIYYQWGADDSLESVANKFEVDPAVIIAWNGNRLDLTNPKIEPESWVMIPGGRREFQQWIIPVAARGSAGVSTGVYGAGACPGGYTGLFGSGAFIWPTNNHTLSGNDYWSGHLAIDTGLVTGDPVNAADTGVIMFAGWSTGGYGYVVAIDHGNGYQTLYAHLSSVTVNCGQSVVRGQLIGAGGSSGNSSGPHLHFEIRYQGGFVNPYYVLPAP
ncbi:MAG: LysM peptidoglycan-binding domain-containing M23 family metallopeptidase [Anaerolineae bacterium]|nr:LysM peptidoglycan-binding domain-containing M23 family metallopeptidase [Anaerolineae bacterium]